MDKWIAHLSSLWPDFFFFSQTLLDHLPPVVFLLRVCGYSAWHNEGVELRREAL